MNSKPGDFVCANAGKYQGRCFVVLSVENQYLYLCNGKNRKLSTPKKIKIKHVKPIEQKNESVLSLLEKGELTNKIVHRAVSEVTKVLKAENL